MGDVWGFSPKQNDFAATADDNGDYHNNCVEYLCVSGACNKKRLYVTIASEAEEYVLQNWSVGLEHKELVLV